MASIDAVEYHASLALLNILPFHLAAYEVRNGDNGVGASQVLSNFVEKSASQVVDDGHLEKLSGQDQRHPRRRIDVEDVRLDLLQDRKGVEQVFDRINGKVFIRRNDLSAELLQALGEVTGSADQ